MLQTIIVYSLLTFVTCSLSSLNKNKYTNLAILIYAIVFGLRYGVGYDYLTYLDAYNYAKDNPGSSLDEFELGFKSLVYLFSRNRIPYILFFGFLAYIQLYIVFYALKGYKYIYPFLFFTFIIGCDFLIYNGLIRQSLSIVLFIFAISKATKKKYIQASLIIIIASLFHRSALLFLPIILFYSFYEKSLFKDIRIQFLIVIGAFYLWHININNIMFANLESIASAVNYSNYYSNNANSFIDINDDRGMGFYLLVFIDIFIIYYSNKVKEYFQSSLVNHLYDLYFIGIIINIIFNMNLMFFRINLYFKTIDFIILAFYLYYFFVTQKESRTNSILFYTLSLLIFMHFTACIISMDSNWMHFYFLWDNGTEFLQKY